MKHIKQFVLKAGEFDVIPVASAELRITRVGLLAFYPAVNSDCGNDDIRGQSA